MNTIEVKMHPEMIDAIVNLARARDISTGQLLRDVASKEINRAKNAKPPVRADERLIAPLRARLAHDFADSDNWQALQHNLRIKGYELREAGGGLALHSYPHGSRQCKASELGYSYSRLMRRFNAPFPGHAHSWLAHRFLNTPESGDDISLTEPF